MKVPFNDLRLQHAPIKDELNEAIAKVVDDCQFIGKERNPYVLAFEEAFADYVGANHCIGCANGTDAIELALRALEIGSGAEVIVPAQTWISTAEAVTMAGATPVFADICALTNTLSPEEIERKITPRTRAIIPVHLHGLPANMPAICEIAQRHSLKVIEDSAQAHGACIQNQHIGTFGDCATFSFFPGKNLGAFGDAGCVVTNDPQIADRIAGLRDHGRAQASDHSFEGRNSRLDGIHAAVLSVKLKYLENWVQLRQKAAERYLTKLPLGRFDLQSIPSGYTHAYHLFALQTNRRDELRSFLDSREIASGIHYVRSLPQLTAYQKLGVSPDDFPNAQTHSQQTISVPLFPEISAEQIDYVSATITEFFNSSAK